MPAGRKKNVAAETLYAFAHQLYWDFRRLTEGKSRSGFDHKKYRQLLGELDSANLQLNSEQKARYEEVVEKEIRSGLLSEAERGVHLRDLEAGGLSVTRAWAKNIAAEESTTTLKVPGEPDVFKELLDAKTPEAVCKICRDAPNWPISPGSVLPMYLE